MLTKLEIKKLPLGFTPIFKGNRSRGKSTKYKIGTQMIKIYQTLPNGKEILRLQDISDRNILKGFNNTILIKGNKWVKEVKNE